MSPTGSPLRQIIGAARDAVRRDAVIATALVVAAVIPAILLVTWLLSLTTSIAHRIPLALDLAGVAIAVAIGFAAKRWWLNRITDRSVAASTESQMGFAEGELQGVLELAEHAPAGTSSALLRRAEHDLARRIGNRPQSEVAGVLGQRTRTHRLHALATAGVLCAAVVLLAFASPERSRASWSPLLKPVATIAATALAPLDVQPGNVRVERGGDVDVKIGARQREAVTLYWKEQGDVLHEQTLPVLSDNARATIGDVDARVRYWVSAPDGAVSDTFTITPSDPLLVSALSIDVVYPAYLQRTSEHFEKDVPPLELPLGTQLRIHGRATRELTSVTLDRGSDRVALNVDGNSFSLNWLPRESGTYIWQMSGAATMPSSAAPSPIEINVIADAAPEVEVTYPGVDTLLPGDMKQLLVADARDDHAVIDAVVVSWRVSATGQRDAVVETPLSIEGDPDRKLVRGVLDATSRKLLPGDSLNYFVRVTDNSPARQSTSSRVYTLRVPGMEEMRESAQQQANDLVKDADALAKAMKQLETRTRDLQRKAVNGGAKSGERGTGGSPGSPDQKQLSAEQADQAKQVLQRQQEMTAEMQKLRDRIESMERAAEQAGLRDPELQKRLDELKQLYDQLLTPEMKKQMQELQKALEKLDPDQVQKALEELAKQQEEMREKLDQSLDLMRRAAAEQEMTKLAQEAKELSTQQEALAEQMKAKEGDQKQNAEKQKDLTKKTDELNSGLAKLQKKLSEQGEGDASAKTGQAQEQTKDAQEAMSQAAKDAQQQNSDKAGEAGKQAADKLDEAAKTLDDARKQMTEGWKKDAQQSVDNATQDAINLAQMQKQILDKMQVSKQIGNAKEKPQQQQGGGQPLQPPSGANKDKQGQQQGGNKESGQQEGGAAGEKGQGQKSGGQQQGGNNNGGSGQPGGNSQNQMQQMRSDQAAVKQGLEQLGKNLQDAGQRSAMVNKDVGSALARANLEMDQTMKAMEQAQNGQGMPEQEAEQTLDALNRLALELLKNSQQIQQSENGTGVQQALQELAELAKQQAGVNGKSNSLLPMNLGPRAMTQQLGALARQQRDIAEKLGGMNKGGARDDLLGRLDDLVKEADNIARDLEGGRLNAQTIRRQGELFHKLLDAGRTIERDEVSEERKSEAAPDLPPAVIRALRPGLFDSNNKYAPPTAEQLKDLPPAYRRLILEYFQKLNASDAAKK